MATDKVVIIDNTGSVPLLNGQPSTIEAIAKATGVDLTLEAKPSPEAQTPATQALAVKRAVAYKMPDGSVKPIGKGRAPLGSVKIAADGTELSAPVVSKAKTPVKVAGEPSYILHPDGSITSKGRGRMAKGCVSVPTATGPIPEGFKPTFKLAANVGDGASVTLRLAVVDCLGKANMGNQAQSFSAQATKLSTFGDTLILANQFVTVE
jgi:hypothetical protein